MEMLQGVWKQHLRPRAVVGYGVKIFLPSPPNYVTRSPGRIACSVKGPGLKPYCDEFIIFLSSIKDFSFLKTSFSKILLKQDNTKIGL